MLQMDTGSEFQSDRSATENAHFPSLVKVNGIVWVRISVEECSPCRREPIMCWMGRKTFTQSINQSVSC